MDNSLNMHTMLWVAPFTWINKRAIILSNVKLLSKDYEKKEIEYNNGHIF